MSQSPLISESIRLSKAAAEWSAQVLVGNPGADIQILTGIFNYELFVPKGFDGIQFRGLHCRPYTED